MTSATAITQRAVRPLGVARRCKSGTFTMNAPHERWSSSLPHARTEIKRWRREYTGERPGGARWAETCEPPAIDNVCFITSANLTGHAMEQNMEAGVLITGGPIPKQLQEHLQALVYTKIVSPV